MLSPSDLPLVLRQESLSPLSADNVAARDAVFQMLSLRRALERLGRVGASTLFAGMALAATGAPVEIRSATAFASPVAAGKTFHP